MFMASQSLASVRSILFDRQCILHNWFTKIKPCRFRKFVLTNQSFCRPANLNFMMYCTFIFYRMHLGKHLILKVGKCGMGENGHLLYEFDTPGLSKMERHLIS